MKKRLIILIIISLILILFLKKIINVNHLKYKISYDNETFFVEETYRTKDYYIEIKSSKSTFPFRIRDSKQKKIIKKIYYYSDDKYECILPILDDGIKIDAMCFKDSVLYDYKSIIGENDKLDEFISSIEDYSLVKFSDDTTSTKNIDDSIYYISNDVGHSVYITSYKGLTHLNGSINIFQNDVYENKISSFLDNYYITADYDNSFEFQYFYVINLKNNKVYKIKSKKFISFDSYIQGIVDNKVYLYDKDNENQYEVDIDKKTIKEISTSNKIKYYKNNKWEYINKSKKELYFNYSNLNNYFTKYDKVIEADNYYYLFKSIDDYYKLYRVDINNINIIKYIMDIPITDIKYKDDYIYYVYKDKIYFYSDYTGKKTLLQNNELEFNNSIKYYIY